MSHNCRQVTEIVTEYLEGRMSLTQRMRFRLTLAICPSCQIYVEQMQQTVSVLGKMPVEPIPTDIHDELCNAFRNWKSGKPID